MEHCPQRQLFNLKSCATKDLPSFRKCSSTACYQDKKNADAVFIRTSILVNILRKWSISQSKTRKLKVMSIYMKTYKNWIFYRTKFLKIFSHKDILCRVKNCPQKQKTYFKSFFFLQWRNFTFSSISFFAI